MHVSLMRNDLQYLLLPLFLYTPSGICSTITYDITIIIIIIIAYMRHDIIVGSGSIVLATAKCLSGDSASISL